MAIISNIGVEANKKYLRDKELEKARFVLGNPTIDQNYITNYGTSAQKFYTDSVSGLGNVTWDNAQKTSEGFKQSADNLRYQQLLIEDWLEKNAEPGSYGGITEALKEYGKGFDSLGAQYSKIGDLAKTNNRETFDYLMAMGRYANSTFDDIQREINVLSGKQRRQDPEAASQTQKEIDLLKRIQHDKQYVTVDDYDKAIADIDRKIATKENEKSKVNDNFGYHSWERPINTKNDPEIESLKATKEGLIQAREMAKFTELPTKLGNENFKLGYENGMEKAKLNPTVKELEEWGKKYDAADDEGKQKLYDERPKIVDPLGMVVENPDFLFQFGPNSSVGKYIITETFAHGRDWHWDQIDEDEKKIYYFWLNRGGVDKAMEYLDLVENGFGQRWEEKRGKEIADVVDYFNLYGRLSEKTDFKPLKTYLNVKEAGNNWLLNAALTPLKWVAESATFVENARDYMVGNEINPYKESSAPRFTFKGIQQKGAQSAKEIGNVNIPFTSKNIFEEAYNLTSNMAESTEGAALLGPLYTVFAGTGAANQAAEDAFDRGGNNNEVFFSGLAAGVSEALFEYVSIDALLKNADNFVPTLKNFLVQTLKQGGVEASEEFCTELSNKIFDRVIMDGKSAYNLRIKELMDEDPSMTAEEASQKAFTEQFKDVLWATFSGFLSGGGQMAIMGTPSMISSYYNKSKVTRAININMGQTIKKTPNANAVLEYARNEKISGVNKNTTVDSISDEILGQVGNKVYDNIAKRIESANSLDEVQAVMDEVQTKYNSTMLTGWAAESFYKKLADNPEWQKEVATKSAEPTVASDTVATQPEKTYGNILDDIETDSVLPKVSAVSPEADPTTDWAYEEQGIQRLTDDQKFIKSVAKSLGTDVVFKNLDVIVKDKNGKRYKASPNGYFDKATGKLYINSSKNVQGNPLMFVFKHELTHFAEGDKTAYTEAYIDFANGVMSSQAFRDWVASKGFEDTVDDNGKPISATLKMNESYRKRYGQSGLKGTERFNDPNEGERAANEEMVADFVAENLFSGDMSRLQEALTEVKPENVNKFKQFILDILHKLKEVFAKRSDRYVDIASIENEFIKTCEAAKKVWEQREQKTDDSLDNEQRLAYNYKSKRGETYVKTDEFRKLQAECQRMSDKDIQLYHSGSKQIDDGLRERFSRSVKSIFLESKNNGISYDKGILNLNAKNNNFNMHEGVNGSLFHDVFEMARRHLRFGELVDLHEVKTTEDHGIGYKYCNNYLSEDGLSGFSITPDGDLISVFNASGKSGFLRAIAPVVKEKAKTLDCYASENQNLMGMYSAIFGFKTASIMDYNMEFDHDNIAENHGMPQIAFMVNTEDNVVIKHFTKDQYDEAVAYRNSFITPENKQYSLPTQTDTEYMEAVENGDMETAQKMVDEAAKKAGYTIEAYHGTDADFWTFSLKNRGRNGEMLGVGYYFTNDKSKSEMYSKNTSKVKHVFLSIKKSVSSERMTITAEEWGKFLDYSQEHKDKYIAGEWKGNVVNKEFEIKWMTEFDNDTEFIKTFIDVVAGENAPVAEGYMKMLKDSIGYDGVRYQNNEAKVYVTFTPEQIKSADPVTYDNKGNVIPLSQRFNPQNEDIRWSLPDNFSELSKMFKDGQLTEEEFRAALDEKEDNNNPISIANLKPEDATTTPPIQPKQGQSKGDKVSNTYGSLMGSDIFDDRFKAEVKTDTFVQKYQSVTNKETLRKAADMLDEGGKEFVESWWKKPTDEASLVDVAIGFILTDRYQRVGDYESATAASEKVREMGTKSGQTVQLFSILGRYDANTMVYYAQKTLDKTLEAMSTKKFEKWVNANKEKFKLTANEIEEIRRKTFQAAALPDGSRAKAILLAEICTLIQNKIPPKVSDSIRAWQRISMLLNVKTNIRNIVGNAGMVIPFIATDFFGIVVDKALSKQYGTARTTGVSFNTNVVKAFGKGFYESWDDFKRGIHTRQEELNRYEVEGFKGRNPGKNFNENTEYAALNKIAKALNGVDRFTSFCLEAGDRTFFEAWMLNSLNNQMKLNGVTEATPEMVEVAIQTALERTWQDSNMMSRFVSNGKQWLNGANIGGYGLGDVIIKFTKTPANIAKAIVDFSPFGFIPASLKLRDMKIAFEKGRLTPLMQSQAVNSMSKAVVGTLIYLLTIAAASMGVIKLSGDSDDDKDVANFEKYIVGIPPYSVEFFGTHITYDWMQPFGSTLAIVSEFMENRRDKTTGWGQDLVNAVLAGGEVFSQQSFLKGFYEFFSNSDDNIIVGIFSSLLSEPSVYIPQLLSQVANVTDPYRRTSYDTNPVVYSLKQVMNKIPGIRTLLPKQVNVMGEDIKNNQYMNPWLAFASPYNTYPESSGKVAEEIYSLYKSTEDIGVLPNTAPNSFSVKGHKYAFSVRERQQLQRDMGQTSAEMLNKFFSSKEYKKLDDSEKAEVIKYIYKYAFKVAKFNAVKEDYNYELLSDIVGYKDDEKTKPKLSKSKYNSLSDKVKIRLIEEEIFSNTELSFKSYDDAVKYYIKKAK